MMTESDWLHEFPTTNLFNNNEMRMNDYCLNCYSKTNLNGKSP